MKSSAVGRTAIDAGKALFGFLVWASIAPGSIEASCSHYARTKSASPIYDLSFTVPGHARIPKEATAPTSAPGPARRAHCSGAFCSGQPASPPAPAQRPATRLPVGGPFWSR